MTTDQGKNLWDLMHTPPTEKPTSATMRLGALLCTDPDLAHEQLTIRSQRIKAEHDATNLERAERMRELIDRLK